ncbi:hypothetical protein V1515DRAFT_531724 [Lipomyces mesembrius]
MANKEVAQKSKKVKLYPTAEEKNILERWIGTARWTYNECLRAIKVEGVARSKKVLRARKRQQRCCRKIWPEDTPYEIRDAAMDDLLKAFAPGAARYKNDKNPFDIRYRSRNKCFQESIVIHSKLVASRQEKLSYDSRLVKGRHPRHFTCVYPGQ